jgi:hypothetical protein
MSRADLKSLSTEELWELRQALSPLLARQLAERAESAAKRLKALNTERPRIHRPFPNAVPPAADREDAWRQRLVADLRIWTRWLESRAVSVNNKTSARSPGRR